MVTYADVQRIYRNEKALPSLEKIDKDFYEGYVKLLSSMSGEHKTYLEKLGNEVFERRKVKIVLAAMRSPNKEPSNMTPVEKDFFCSILKAFEEHKEKAFSLEGAVTEEKKERHRKVEKAKLKFVSAVPAVIGTDLVHYGPFNEGDTADIPLENARILVEQGIAEEI